MQVKFISSISFNMPAIYPHHIETHYIRCHISIHYDRTIYLCLPPFFLWMLPYNHLSISIFKFHLRFYLKNSATMRGVSPSFLYIHSLLPMLPDFVQCFRVRFCKKRSNNSIIHRKILVSSSQTLCSSLRWSELWKCLAALWLRRTQIGD